MAPGAVDPATLLWAVTGTALCSASANSFNQWMEIPYDSMMTRTKNRVLVRKLIRWVNWSLSLSLSVSISFISPSLSPPPICTLHPSLPSPITFSQFLSPPPPPPFHSHPPFFSTPLTPLSLSLPSSLSSYHLTIHSLQPPTCLTVWHNHRHCWLLSSSSPRQSAHRCSRSSQHSSLCRCLHPPEEGHHRQYVGRLSRGSHPSSNGLVGLHRDTGTRSVCLGGHSLRLAVYSL